MQIYFVVIAVSRQINK